MELDTFIRDGGFDPATLNDAQRRILTAAWKAAHAPADPPKKEPTSLAEIQAKAEAEHKRRRHITETVEREMSPAINSHLTQQDREFLRAIGDKAISDNWDSDKFELEVLRAKRPHGGFAVQTPGDPGVTDAVLEAAVCKNAGLDNREKHFKAEVLEAADRHFPHGMSIADLTMHYARRGGYTGHTMRANPEGAWRAAKRATDIQAAGTWGPSTQGASIGSLLANVANKFFREAFMAVDSSWRAISARRSVNDFKQVTTWSLTGDLTFKKLPPGGEIQHGQVDGTSYTNQVDTYARMLGLDRRDIINDDLGAFASVARRLGRGGAIALNKLFWGVFANNSTFFTAGRNNFISGAGTNLQLSQLDVLNQKFLLQTDPDGNLLGVTPAILLVPPALKVTAQTLMASTMLTSGAASPGAPATNIWAGAFEVVVSPYLQDATLTGNSATAWYLLANPNDLPVIEVAFLNGQETPMVEESAADFSQLGQAFRGVFDIGVGLQEYRAGAKSAGQ